MKNSLKYTNSGGQLELHFGSVELGPKIIQRSIHPCKDDLGTRLGLLSLFVPRIGGGL